MSQPTAVPRPEPLDRLLRAAEAALEASAPPRSPERAAVARVFGRVRARIGKVIDALSEKTLFNIVAFADAGQAWQNEMVPATEQNKRDAKKFLLPFNTKGRYGLDSGNVQSSNQGLPAGGGTTRLDLALPAAFLQGADTILIISDGLPKVQKQLTADQNAAWNAKIEAWQNANKAALEAYSQAMANMTYREEKVHVPARGASLKEGNVHGPVAAHAELRRVPPTPVPHRPQRSTVSPGASA